jgi:hypothetical protein
MLGVQANRHDHDLRQFARRLEAIVELFEDGIPIAGTHCCHKEHLANMRAATPDATPSFELATFKGVGATPTIASVEALPNRSTTSAQPIPPKESITTFVSLSC